MPNRSLVAALSAVVVLLALGVVFLSLSASKTTQDVGGRVQQCDCPPGPKRKGPLPEIRIVVDGSEERKSGPPSWGDEQKQLLVDIRQTLRSLLEALSERTLKVKVEHGALKVEHRLESVNDDLLGKIRNILQSIGVSVAVTTSGNVPASSGACRVTALKPIRGFPVGKHTPEVRNGSDKDPCLRIARKFRDQLDGRALSHLVLIGRTDRMAFDDPRYDGNRGLAQARASWVHQCLREKLPGMAADVSGLDNVVDVLENRTILLSAGPLHVPACSADPDCDDKTRALDRSVDVFACLVDPPATTGSTTEVPVGESADDQASAFESSNRFQSSEQAGGSAPDVAEPRVGATV